MPTTALIPSCFFFKFSSLWLGVSLCLPVTSSERNMGFALSFSRIRSPRTKAAASNQSGPHRKHLMRVEPRNGAESGNGHELSHVSSKSS